MFSILIVNYVYEVGIETWKALKWAPEADVQYRKLRRLKRWFYYVDYFILARDR